MKSRTTWLFLFLVLIGGIWAFPKVMLHSPFGPAALERKFNARNSGQLTIGKTSIRIIPRLRLLLHDVQWQGPSSSPTYSRQLQIEKVDLAIHFPALLRGNLETDVILFAPQLHFSVDGEHGLNPVTLENRPGVIPPALLGLGKIHSLTIADGNYISERHLEEGKVKHLLVKQINIHIAKSKSNGSMHLKGSARLFAGRPTLLDLDFEAGSLWDPAAVERRIEIRSGTVDISGMIMEVHGNIVHKSPFNEVDITLATQAFSVEAFSEALPKTVASLPERTADSTGLNVLLRGVLSSAKAVPIKFRLESPEMVYTKPVRAHIAQAIIEGEYDFETLQFSTLHGKVCDGILEGSGRVNIPKTVKPSLLFDLHAKNLTLHKCETFPLKPYLTGHLDGHLKLYGTFHKPSAIQIPHRIPQWLSGTGEITVRRGQIQKLHIMQTFGTTINQFVAIPTMAIPHFRDENWRKVQSRFSFEDGSINISSLTMDSDDMQFKAEGDIGPKDRLDIDGNFILGADLMQSFGRKIFYFLTPDGLLVVPLEITGTINHPHVFLDFGRLLDQDTWGQAKKFIPPPIQKEFRELYLVKVPSVKVSDPLAK